MASIPRILAEGSATNGVVSQVGRTIVAGGIGGGAAAVLTTRNKKRKRLQIISKSQFVPGHSPTASSQGGSGAKGGVYKPISEMSRSERGFLKRQLGNKAGAKQKAPFNAQSVGSGRVQMDKERYKKFNSGRRAKNTLNAYASDRKASAPKSPLKSSGMASRKFVQSSQVASVGTGAGIAAGSVALLARRAQQRKEGKKPIGGPAVDVALGAGGGFAGGDAVSTATGWGTKRASDAYRKKNYNSKVHDPIWNAYKKEKGFTQMGAKHSKDRVDARKPSVQRDIGRHYPKAIPGANAKRFLAFKNRPAVIGGYIAATAGGGALAAHRLAKDKNTVSKSMSAFEVAHSKSPFVDYGFANSSLSQTERASKAFSAISKSDKPRSVGTVNNYKHRAGEKGSKYRENPTGAAAVGAVGGGAVGGYLGTYGGRVGHFARLTHQAKGYNKKNAQYAKDLAEHASWKPPDGKTAQMAGIRNKAKGTEGTLESKKYYDKFEQMAAKYGGREKVLRDITPPNAPTEPSMPRGWSKAGVPPKGRGAIIAGTAIGAISLGAAAGHANRKQAKDYNSWADSRKKK